MKTNKLPIKVRVDSLNKTISQTQKIMDRLVSRLGKIRLECKHESEFNKNARVNYQVFFDCSECGARIYKRV